MNQEKFIGVRHIGRRLVVIILLPVVVIIISAGVISNLRLRTVLNRLAEERLAADAVFIASGISAELRTIENSLNVASLVLEDTFDFSDYATAGDRYVTEYRDGMAPYLRKAFDEFPGALGLYFMTAPGIGSVPSQVWFHDEEADGNPVRQFEYPDPGLFDPDDPRFDYYYSPIGSGAPCWSDVYADADIGRLVISYAIPIRSSDRIVGILGLDYSMAKFDDILSPYRPPGPGYPFLYSAGERMIFHPVLEFGLSLADFEDPDSVDLTARLRAAAGEGVFRYRYAGSDKIMGYSRLSNGWFLGVTFTEDYVLSEVNRNLLTLTVFTFVLAGLAFVFAVILSRIIVQPLVRMHREIEKSIADWYYIPDLASLQNRRDEFGELSRAFIELRKVNREVLEKLLKENIDKERLSVMGDKLPELSHEVEGKLGIINTGISYVRETLGEACREAPNPCPGMKDLMESHREALDLALKSSAYASRIIRSVKNTSAVQTHLERTDFNLRLLVEDTVVSLEYLAKRKKIQWDITIPPDMIVRGYPGYFTQILDNLIGNSLRHGFRDVSAGTISINAVRDGDVLNIEYSDDGAGIPYDHRVKVFDRFFTTAGDAGGTGIGLYLVRALIENEMGGTIELVDDDVPGVHFRISVPTADILTDF